MGVSLRKLAPLWALALALACAQHTALNPAHNGRVCSTWGDFHYKTFDGDVFRFPGLCNYVFSSHCGAAYEDFDVQLRRGQGSAPSKVVMKLDGMVVELTQSSVLVNGHHVQLPFSQSGVLIEHSSSYVKVVARLGLVFMWNQDNSLLLELDSKYANQTCGLCGDFNGVPGSEFLSHNVKLTPVEFGNLQKMDGPTEQCQDPAPEPQKNCSTGFGICEEVLGSPLFFDCAALVHPGSYIEACRQDLCLCQLADLASCVCHTLAEYSRQCAHAGGLPGDWRGPDLCPQTCPHNMQYRECHSPCADTCSNLEHSQVCEDHCVSGCFCPEGMVFDDIGQTGCVPVSQCACVYNGATYAPGAVYSTDCSQWYVPTPPKAPWDVSLDVPLRRRPRDHRLVPLVAPGDAPKARCPATGLAVKDTRLGGQGAARPSRPQHPLSRRHPGDSLGGREGKGRQRSLGSGAAALPAGLCAPSVLMSSFPGPPAKPLSTCPKSMTYSYHISSCQPTCRALGGEDATCHISFVPVDGCTCPEGTFLDDLGKCVPASSCPCYHRDSVVPNGESVHDGSAVCTCTQGKLTCIGGPVPTPVCAAPMVYFDCRNATPGATGAGCQKACHTLDMACYATRCVPGCVCPDGLVSDGEGGCIAVEDCPCVHNEASYQAGQTIRVGCNTCTCEDRMWQCTDEPCMASCAVYGDGHYVTFDGQRYSFSGDCEYTLVQDHCGGNGSTPDAFRVVTENVPCGTTGTTCSKAIKIFLGSSELKLSDGKVEVIEKGTGQEVPYSIRQMGIYLVVDTDAGLLLQWDRKTSIVIRLSPELKGRVCGLCGNFDSNAINDFTTRSQSVVGSVLEFGNSWKFSPSCPDARVPRDPCTANPYRKSWAQKQCSIINSATFAACRAHVEPTKYYEACVSDACACDSGGDCECFCTAVAAYAQACQEAGVWVSWRTDVCPLFCDYYNPEGQCQWHYQPCGAPCMRTCRNPRGQCLHDVHGLEGCYPKCPAEAPIFDEDKMQCVAKCPVPPPTPCYVHGKAYRPGTSVPSDKNCQSCVCTESGVRCTYDAGACVCTYDGQHFRPGDIIYHTTDGTGACISARCGANGTIDRSVQDCSSSTPMPPTTFFFSTSLFAPGPQGGDQETYSNIIRSGERICHRPEEITRLECRAESHPEVSIETLGQVVVRCDRDVGLECRNHDQPGPFQMCLNYEVRVLCCEPADADCPLTSVPPYATSTITAHPAPSTSIVPTSSASSVAHSTQTCFCSVRGQLFPAGSIIYNQTDLSGHCFYALCTHDCQVVREVDRDCPSTTPPPASATSLSMSTSAHVTKQGCPNAVPPRKLGETWPMPNCSQATCEGDHVISLQPRKCPQVKKPTCANGYPALKVADQDGCCHHYQCQCVCSGWGDPHYITFDGVYYTFLDNCTYVLVQQIVPVYGHFRVLVNNYFCTAEDGLSCPQAIIVEYQQDQVVLTSKLVGGVTTNQIIFNNEVVRPGFRKNGIVTSRVGIKMYVTIPEIGVQVMFTGLIFSVEVPFSKFANNTEGQCGTCTNDRQDECRLPGGTLASSCSEMSGFWNVTVPGQPSCHRPPQTPTTVRPTTSPAPCPESSVCQLILSDVFELCHAVIPPWQFYEGCVFDQCHVADAGLACSSLQLYASLCAWYGVCIDWRGRTNDTCLFSCPADKVYQPCGPTSPAYCYGNDSASLVSLEEAGPITEGCFCPEGTVPFSSDVEVCVPVDCPRCLGPHGEPVEPGHTISVDCQECTCEGSTRTLACRRKACPLPPACPLPGFVPVPAAPQADQCCPQYSCGLVGCHFNGTLYQPGAVVSSDLCETCRCEVPGGPQLDTFVVSCETQICNTHCPVGFEYQVQSGQCCGTCVQVACVTNSSGSPAHLFHPGETWTDPGNHCVTHECEKHQDGLVVVTVKKSCPPLRCPPDQAELSEDGCCLSCRPSYNRSTCAVHYKNQIIRQWGCSSARPVPLAYCQGNCGDTASMYSLEASMMKHSCRCCQELRTSLRNVTLQCADGSSRAFSYTQVEECSCQGLRCHSEEPGSEQSEEDQSQETERRVRGRGPQPPQ
ncbi:Mucin-5AC [Tupaia chinensis]|uniref:Mucin-5AC n=1 Tax=Tupaia chinensis TaxID=246437 RepID=L8Y8N8_TUPCH|nr:Mucin-5AC [Tupaia chinensis]